MTYNLIIGDRSFSSWSLRGWLMLEKFGLDFRTTDLSLYDGSYRAVLAPMAPAKLLPVLVCPDGTVMGETMAIAEELNSRHPEAGMWPSDPQARAFARWISAEMCAGFMGLRSACPMQLLHQYVDFPVSDDFKDDLDRVQDLWTRARKRFGADGPWLFGQYSLADAFFAPVAARIAGHGLPVGEVATDYVATVLADPSFRRWRALGLTKSYDPVPYAMDHPTRAWPGPKPLAAQAVEGTDAVNKACPYSGDAITHCLTLNGVTYGFCNETCRDKTVADPEAWPAFMALVAKHS
ncbi:glutathione S-transferase [Thalassovita mediterranea]|jgi:glutathione S-transferase|uniref:Glutathione S-transferase YfcF n=1 Tax=Thalassovita mediterranea TaxID=340021 RepID=A0A0P1H2Y3_9RHOB|nr:glutathione S-transferase [Thalassovita mediterranea]CUH83000.1 Glutathione S-transferase YfcF [Thalassovita mediterranea]SIS31270.1 glutathione S-transferase [Thalassovita mediterranea]